jgi:predicted esterase
LAAEALAKLEKGSRPVSSTLSSDVVFLVHFRQQNLRDSILSEMDESHSACFEDGARKGRKGLPEPLIIPPSTKHTHSVILLHGRGSNATRFGLELLDSKTSSGKSLQQLFPSVKFIFPTAKKRRSTILKRVKINQWFDNYSLEDPSERQDLQYEGLKETAEFIHKLVKQEAASLAGGLGNVIIGGLSQGCAMALIVLLSFAGNSGHADQLAASDEGILTSKPRKKSLGGFIGMSGWLPFAQDIVSAALPNLQTDNDEDEDPFGESPVSKDPAEGSDVDECMLARQLRAANFVRDIVDLAPLQQTLKEPGKENDTSTAQLYNTPCFLGHGTADEKVSFHLGEESRDTLQQFGLDVTWRQYDEFGHWYKVPDELDDIACFLRGKVGLR